MVISDDSGQLFTIEGLVAGLIMMATAFIIVGSLNVYTPGDAHISDMQLKQLGSDALLMLDTPDNYGEENTLKELAEKVSNGGADAVAARTEFKTAFEDELEEGTGSTEIIDSIRYNATVYYRDIGTDSIKSYALGDSGSEISRQPAISTGRLILVESGATERIFRVEVRLWRE
ncbi:MAG: hypothetical protein JW931_07360 [Methanomicrobiaceae archaeon]|nr:hypothetical protein [Methanomicrobiaceae archaeon]